MNITARKLPPIVLRGTTAACDSLRHAAGITSLAVLSVLLMGCGLTLNPASAGSAGTGVSGQPGGSGGNGSQIVPVPGAMQALTGCTNPNTGVSNGDWGVGGYPVYTAIDNTAPVVGMPIYTTNAVFWTSRENAPGQSILLAGAFTDAKKTARIAFIPPGTIDWQSLVRGSTTVTSTIQQGTTGLSFIVPAGFPAGVYGYQIEDPSAPSILGWPIFLR